MYAWFQFLQSHAYLYIRTHDAQKISIFRNLHPVSLHAGMQSVTRESKGQLLVKLLGTDSFRNSYRSVYPGGVEKFCSLRMGPLPLSFQDPPNQGRSIFSVLVSRARCFPASKPLKETIRRLNGIKVACKNVAFNLD